MEFCKRLDVFPDDVLGTTRREPFVSLRHLYYFLLYTNGITYKNIAILNDKDRVTVFYAIKRIRELLEVGDKQTKYRWEQVKDIKRERNR
jgi:chromosomal replication initiation ATPase DnaA